MINFAVINLKSTIKNLSKIIIVLLLIIGIVNLSDLIRNAKINFNYIDLVKSCIDYNFDNNSIDGLSLDALRKIKANIERENYLGLVNKEEDVKDKELVKK